MTILDTMKKRYTCKVYDPSKKFSQADIQKIKDLLRESPSSVNSQPWHFFLIESEDGKNRVLPAIMEANQPKIKDSALTVVFCAKNQIDDAHIQHILETEDKDKRYATPEMKAANDQGRRFFIDLNSKTNESQNQWEHKQLYIALGTLLLGSASLGFDSTAIEGFFPEKMDEVLGLKEKGLHSVVVVTLGYRSAEDYNAPLPKSRFDEKEIFTTL